MIYVLEDDKNIRKLLRFALSGEGFETREFSEADSFYIALYQEIPRLLLLDVMLPGDDGFTVLKKISNNSATENMPVIMLTAKNSEIDKLQGLDGGADDYVTKPFGIAELMARIRAVLRRSEGTKTKRQYKYLSMVLDDEKHQVKLDGEIVPLSKKEYGLLLMLLKAEGKVC